MGLKKKRNRLLLFGLLFCLVGGFVFLFFQVTKQQTGDVKKKQKDTDKKAQKKTSKENDDVNDHTKDTSRTIKGKTALKFDRYKEFYKQELNSGFTFKSFKKYYSSDCDNKENAILELLFFKRNQKGDVEPLPVEVVRYDVLSNSCDTSGMGIGLEKSFRQLYFVRNNKNCRCSGSTFFREGRYRIEHITYYDGDKQKKLKDLNYILDVSQFDLTFKKEHQKPEGTKDDPVYRHAILLEDLLKTKGTKKERKLPEDIKLKVSGIDQLGKRKKTLLVYYLDQKRHIVEDQDGPNQTVNTHKIKKENALGGALAVYAKNKGNDRKNFWLKLLQYQKKVSSTSIDLSEEVDFDHRKVKWITRKIDLRQHIETYIEEHENGEEIIKGEFDEPVRLMMPTKQFDRGNATGINVFARLADQKENSFTVELSAPKGTYHLLFGEEILVKNYKWPPK